MHSDWQLDFLRKIPLNRIFKVFAGGKELEALIKENIGNLNTPDEYGQYLLHIAVEHFNAMGVIYLLHYGADRNKRNIYNETPLELACRLALHHPAIYEIHLIIENLKEQI